MSEKIELTEEQARILYCVSCPKSPLCVSCLDYNSHIKAAKKAGLIIQNPVEKARREFENLHNKGRLTAEVYNIFYRAIEYLEKQLEVTK